MKLHSFFKKLSNLLQGKRRIGGLEISDSAILYTVFQSKEWKLMSTRLAPGVIEAGQVKNQEAFDKALSEFRAKLGAKKHKKTPVILSLSSLNVYSQVFSLPSVRGQSMEDAVKLNLQMIAPADFTKMNSGWQIVGEDVNALKSEILAAFVPKTVIDPILTGLGRAGFSVVAVESRALSLARLIREQGAGIDLSKPYAVFSVDDIGLDVLIVRHGQIYFEYFNSWHDLRGDERQIPVQVFEDVIVRDLYQVFNFYNQHWPEPLTDVLIVATGLQAEIARIVKANFSLVVSDLSLKLKQVIGPEWFVALGSGVRGTLPRNEDVEISLSGTDAKEEYRQEQVLDFLRFWRILAPISLFVLIAIFSAGSWFLNRSFGSIARTPIQQLSSEQMGELTNFQAEAAKFNESIDAISSVRNSFQPKYKPLQLITSLTTDQRIVINSFSFQGYGTQVTLRATAPTTADIRTFNDKIGNDLRFQDVTVPPSSIVEGKEGSLFTMTFSMVAPTSANTP